MLNRNIKVIKLFNGMTVQLNESPWAIKIEDEKNIPEEYWKEKITKSIDKIKLDKKGIKCNAKKSPEYNFIRHSYTVQKYFSTTLFRN